MENGELENIYDQMSSPNFDFSSLLPSEPEPPELNLPQGTELVPFPKSSLINPNKVDRWWRPPPLPLLGPPFLVGYRQKSLLW